MEPLDNPSKDFPCCIWIREQTCLWLFGQWLLVSLWSVFGQWLFGQSRKLLLLLSLAGWILPPSPSSDVNSKPVVQPGSYAMDCVGYTAGWPTSPTSLVTIPRSIRSMLVVEVRWNQGVRLP